MTIMKINCSYVHMFKKQYFYKSALGNPVHEFSSSARALVYVCYCTVYARVHVCCA